MTSSHCILCLSFLLWWKSTALCCFCLPLVHYPRRQCMMESLPESQLLHTGQLATGTQWHAWLDKNKSFFFYFFLFFLFLFSDSICLYTNWKHSFLWDNNTKCLVKLKWMLIKLNVLTLHRGKKYILCCESYPFLHKSFFFSIQKINIFFIRNCKWELKLWRNMNIWKHTRLLFKASFKGKLMNRFLQKAYNPKEKINQALRATCTAEAWPLLLVIIP